MADDIRQLQIGDPSSLVSGTVTVDNTTGTVNATLTALANGIQVPVVITGSTVDASGNVNIMGNTALGAAVNVNLNEQSATATVNVNALGINTTATVNVTCYCTGTLIRTPEGEVAVEDLKIGDIVVTASGEHRAIRWIGHRDYAGRFANANPELLPICIRANAVAANVPARDLWVSPKHAVFLEGVLIPVAALLNGVSVFKAEKVETLTYWHVELDSHDVLVAENLPSESFVNDCGRAIFHNAASFHERYPDFVEVEADYCAPRVEAGHIVEGVRRRINERAGMQTSAPKFGALNGYVDAFDGTSVSGWAQDALYPTAPVCLDVLVNGTFVAHVYADGPSTAASPQDRHGFRLELGAASIPGSTVEVRRSADGAKLAAAPRHAAAQAA